MPLQTDLTTLIDGGLNRRDVNIRDTRSDHHGPRRCACRKGDRGDGREQEETKHAAYPFHIVHLRLRAAIRDDFINPRADISRRDLPFHCASSVGRDAPLSPTAAEPSSVHEETP